MRMLGIDSVGHLYYEGESPSDGYAIWPHPTVSLAICDTSSMTRGETRALHHVPERQLVFREDSFDPVSRVRRGRFYQLSPTATIGWYVQPHPAFREEVGHRPDHAGRLVKALTSYNAWRFEDGEVLIRLIVVLGVESSASRWRIVDVEQILTGEQLVTLKSASRLGVLPAITQKRVNARDKATLDALFDSAADAAHRFGAESVIDRCRDAASALASFWLERHTGVEDPRLLDLAKASAKLLECDKTIAANCGQTIARLHARVKPTEQARRKVPKPNDEDAESALHLLALMARELDYAPR